MFNSIINEVDVDFEETTKKTSTRKLVRKSMIGSLTPKTTEKRLYESPHSSDNHSLKLPKDVWEPEGGFKPNMASPEESKEMVNMQSPDNPLHRRQQQMLAGPAQPLLFTDVRYLKTAR